jgi:hypothetical protein
MAWAVSLNIPEVVHTCLFVQQGRLYCPIANFYEITCSSAIPPSRTRVILFPRCYLFEIGDQSWCPDWLIAYLKSYLTRVWNLHIPPFSKTSPAGVTADLIVENLPDASSFTFVEHCAGAGGPISTVESVLTPNSEFKEGPPLGLFSRISIGV